MRLDLLSGTAIRFEPGDVKQVTLIPFSGERRVFGLNGLVNGQLDDPTVRRAAFERLKEGRYGDEPSE
jgi:urease subunit beta